MPHRRQVDLHSAVVAARKGDLCRATSCQYCNRATIMTFGSQQCAEQYCNLKCRLIALSTLPVLPTSFKELRWVDKQLSNPIVRNSANLTERLG